MIQISYIGTKKGLLAYIGEHICEDCLGVGVLYFMEQDSDGHYANTGIKTCHCREVRWEDKSED